MLSNATREIIERFWATELGCPIEALRQPGISVVPRYQTGAFFLQIGHSLVFSVPELSMKRVEETVELTSAMECFDAAGIAELLGPSVGEWGKHSANRWLGWVHHPWISCSSSSSAVK